MNQRQRAIQDRNPLLQCLLAQGVGVIDRGSCRSGSDLRGHSRTFTGGLRSCSSGNYWTVQAGWQDTGEGSRDPLGSPSPTAGTRRAVAARREAGCRRWKSPDLRGYGGPLDLHNGAYDGTGTWDLGHAR